MKVTAVSRDRDEGTIVVFSGYTREEGEPITFAVDHRMALDLVDAGVGTGAHVYNVDIEPWQVIQ